MSPIKNTKVGYTSLFTDKIETDIGSVLIGATYANADDNFQPGNGYQYLVFTSPGNLYVNKSGPIDIVVIGGGGGGGDGEFNPPSARYAGGGGGAGGFLEKFQVTLPVGDYDISIGAGGARGPNAYPNQPGTNRNGSPGTPSYISGPTIVDLIGYGGGGGGGSYDWGPPSRPAGDGSDGGSGGGTSQGKTTGEGNRTTAIAPATGSPIPSYLQGIDGQGNPGGTYPGVASAGGGGGAVAEGSGPPTGDGGDGSFLWGNDPGIPPTYGTPGPTPGRYFAGGGGGGLSNFAPPFENGGAGGGGRGAEDAPPTTQSSTAGTENTGGGGGGGHEFGRSSPGGSGIVIIRYRI